MLNDLNSAPVCSKLLLIVANSFEEQWENTEWWSEYYTYWSLFSPKWHSGTQKERHTCIDTLPTEYNNTTVTTYILPDEDERYASSLTTQTERQIVTFSHKVL